MPHVLVTAETNVPLRDVVELGRHGEPVCLRFHRLASGDAVVIAPAGAQQDGRQMLGRIAVVDWGAAAIVRALGLRVEVRWEAVGERRTAEPGRRCTLCFEALVAGERVVACRCEALIHPDCADVMVSCPTCGSPRDAETWTEAL